MREQTVWEKERAIEAGRDAELNKYLNSHDDTEERVAELQEQYEEIEDNIADWEEDITEGEKVIKELSEELQFVASGGARKYSSEEKDLQNMSELAMKILKSIGDIRYARNRIDELNKRLISIDRTQKELYDKLR